MTYNAHPRTEHALARGGPDSRRGAIQAQNEASMKLPRGDDPEARRQLVDRLAINAAEVRRPAMLVRVHLQTGQPCRPRLLQRSAYGCGVERRSGIVVFYVILIGNGLVFDGEQKAFVERDL